MQASASHEDAAASFEPLRLKLMRVGYRMLGSVADAEDIVQEAFVTALTSSGNGRIQVIP